MGVQTNFRLPTTWGVEKVPNVGSASSEVEFWGDDLGAFAPLFLDSFFIFEGATNYGSYYTLLTRFVNHNFNNKKYPISEVFFV